MTGRLGATFALLFCAGSLLEMNAIVTLSPLDTLATPNFFIVVEIWLAGIAVFGAPAFLRRLTPATPAKRKFEILRRPIRLPLAARALLLCFTLICASVFALFATMNVAGSYSGPMSSLATYPALGTLYNALGLSFLSFWTVGTNAFVFFCLALLGLTVLLSGRGVWPAFSDALAYFAAPALIAFELGLLSFAPEDMTWHATKFLWIGGIDDHGYRSLSLAAGVTWYPINNWLVLFASLFILAARVPALWRPDSQLPARA